MRHDRPTLREILKGSVRWNSEKSTKKGRQEGKAVTVKQNILRFLKHMPASQECSVP